MIDSAQDILYLVIAFCALWFTIFVCWFIYYVAMIFKQVHNLIMEVREIVGKVEKLMDSWKEKIDKSHNYLSLAVEAIKQGLEMLKARSGAAEEKLKKKRSLLRR